MLPFHLKNNAKNNTQPTNLIELSRGKHQLHQLAQKKVPSVMNENDFFAGASWNGTTTTTATTIDSSGFPIETIVVVVVVLEIANFMTRSGLAPVRAECLIGFSPY